MKPAREFSGRVLSTWGNDAQKELLPSLMSGQIIGAVAMSEEAMNVDNEPLADNRRSQDGDRVKINGRKQYVVNAPIADWFAVARHA